MAFDRERVLRMRKRDSFALAFLLGTMLAAIVFVALAAVVTPYWPPLAALTMFSTVAGVYARTRCMSLNVHSDGRVTVSRLVGPSMIVLDRETRRKVTLHGCRFDPLGRITVLGFQDTSRRRRRPTRMVCSYTNSRSHRNRWVGTLTSLGARAAEDLYTYV